MPRLGVWLLGLVSLLPAAWAAYLLASLDRWAGKGPGFRGAPLWFWVVHLAVFVLSAALLVGYEMHAARHLSPDGGRTKWVVLLMMLSGLVVHRLLGASCAAGAPCASAAAAAVHGLARGQGSAAVLR